MLHTFVFAENENAGEEAAIDGLPTTTTDHHAEISTDLDSAVRKASTRHEAKYLVWALRKAMAVADANPNPNSSRDGSSLDKATLDDAARTRLQYTLLKGIFGAEGTDFGEGLSLPRAADAHADIEVPSVSEDDTSEWFKRELWTLVGWEVVGRHVDVDGVRDG